jgi:hypothetical protein
MVLSSSNALGFGCQARVPFFFSAKTKDTHSNCQLFSEFSFSEMTIVKTQI